MVYKKMAKGTVSLQRPDAASTGLDMQASGRAVPFFDVAGKPYLKHYYLTQQYSQYRTYR
jgi:hypothetical protein